MNCLMGLSHSDILEFNGDSNSCWLQLLGSGSCLNKLAETEIEITRNWT